MLIRYPGGKKKLTVPILQRLNRMAGNGYCEPFVGGGGIAAQYLQENPFTMNMALNDKDAGIACLWRAALWYTEELEGLVNAFVPSVEQFYAIKSSLLAVDAMPTQKADIVMVGFWKLAIHQISYSGLGVMSGSPLGGIHQKSAYTIGCRWSPPHIRRQIKALAALFYGKRTVITSLDFEEVIAETPATIYLDPPYYVKGEALYQHSFTQADHERLATVLRGKRNWLLSYDDAPEIRELYSPWACVEDVDILYSIANTGNKKELLITPYE